MTEAGSPLPRRGASRLSTASSLAQVRCCFEISILILPILQFPGYGVPATCDNRLRTESEEIQKRPLCWNMVLSAHSHHDNNDRLTLFPYLGTVYIVGRSRTRSLSRFSVDTTEVRHAIHLL
jgi:hypothetical protein